MSAAKLIDVIASLGSFGRELTIYVQEPWSPDSEAIVALEPDDGGLPREAESIGAEYFLEIFIALEVLEGFSAEAHGPRSDTERCVRLIRYAIDDA